MNHRYLTVIFASMLLGACVTSTSALDDEERGRLSTGMVNLSSAVDVHFEELASPPVADDATLLEAATAHDPRLLRPLFDGYRLRVQYQHPFAVVLLCAGEGDRAIMEDAGCSARLDRQVTGDAPCEFTLRVTAGCVVEGGDPE